MKVEQTPAVFQPVVITLETLQDVEALKDVVNFYMDNSKNGYGTASRIIADDISLYLYEVIVENE